MSTRNAAVLSFLEKLPMPVVIADTSTGEILWVNGPHLALSGVGSPDRIIGHSIFEFLGPEQTAVAMRDVEAVAHGESPPPVVYHVKRLDGATADVHIASTPISMGRRPAMVSVLTDVTDSERAISDLAKREARYRSLVDGAPAAIVVAVRDEIVYANASFARTMGHSSPAQIVGLSPSRFFDTATRAKIRDARARVLVEGSDRSVEMEVVAMAAGGAAVPGTGVISALEWDDEPATRMVFRSRLLSS